MNQLNYYRKKFTILTFLIICLSTALFLTGCGKSQEKPAPTSEKETTLTGLDTQDETEPDTEEKSTDSPIPAESKITPAVFRATDADGHEIYLMGSIHLADADAAVYPDYFEKIYQWSDALAVECDTTNSLSSA